MDYPLGEKALQGQAKGLMKSLNPYSNGLPSRGRWQMCFGPSLRRLNPYSNGLPSRGNQSHTQRSRSNVCLNPYSNGLPSRGNLMNLQTPPNKVLIPILMDYPLGVFAYAALKWADGLS